MKAAVVHSFDKPLAIEDSRLKAALKIDVCQMGCETRAIGYCGRIK